MRGGGAAAAGNVMDDALFGRDDKYQDDKLIPAVT